MPPQLRPAVFLERDGILNSRVMRQDGTLGSPLTRDQLQVEREAGAFLQRLNTLGFLAIVVTDQPDVELGLLTPSRLEHIHLRLRTELARNHAKLDGIYTCPHAPGVSKEGSERPACNCRKPAPGLILRAAKIHRTDLHRSFVISDSLDDIESGRRVGVRAILVEKSAHERAADRRPAARPDHVVPGLMDALAIIEKARKDAAGSADLTGRA